MANSIIVWLGLPSEFGYILLTFTFILALAPWLSGSDFGIFRIPVFSQKTKKILKIIGPILFLIVIVIHIPIVPPPTENWWVGFWDCNIDGRTAVMKWEEVSQRPVSWNGFFSDNNGPWDALVYERTDNNGGLYFRHANGNLWFLAKPTNDRTQGWTTWNGSRYKLSCWR